MTRREKNNLASSTLTKSHCRTAFLHILISHVVVSNLSRNVLYGNQHVVKHLNQMKTTFRIKI